MLFRHSPHPRPDKAPSQRMLGQADARRGFPAQKPLNEGRQPPKKPRGDIWPIILLTGAAVIAASMTDLVFFQNPEPKASKQTSSNTAGASGNLGVNQVTVTDTTYDVVESTGKNGAKEKYVVGFLDGKAVAVLGKVVRSGYSQTFSFWYGHDPAGDTGCMVRKGTYYDFIPVPDSTANAVLQTTRHEKQPSGSTLQPYNRGFLL